MSLDDEHPLRRDFLHGYSTTRDLLKAIFDPKEGSDFAAASRRTRAEAMARSGTIMEDLGHDVAWVVYHCRHPVRAYQYRRSRKES